MDEPQLKKAQAERTPSADGERVSLARAFGGRSLLREILETSLLAIIIFLTLNVATARFQVRGPSMEPTLHSGQYLIVSKLGYWFHSPERGDIVVLHPHTPTEDYIKRIVGLPGETVEIQDGKVWVNGVPIEEPYIAAPPNYSTSLSLGEREYFVLGDNRNNSNDSHSWGALSQENIVGKAWLCYWPPEEWGAVAHHVFPETEGQD